jgi:hypothetical protein
VAANENSAGYPLQISCVACEGSIIIKFKNITLRKFIRIVFYGLIDLFGANAVQYGYIAVKNDPLHGRLKLLSKHCRYFADFGEAFT